MKSKGSLVVQNAIQITINRFQDIFTFSKQICQLPSIFYIILLFFWFFQSTLPLLLSGLDDVWNDSPYIKNLIQFFQIFWRFSSFCTEDLDIIINFCVMTIIPVLCFIPLMIGYIKFVRGHTFSQSLAYIINFFFEIFLVFFHTWFPSEIATLIGIISNDKSKCLSFHFYFIILLFIFCILHYFICHYFVFGESFYSSGRAVFWDSRTRLISIFFIDLILFFTRLVEVLPKVASIIFTFLTIIVCILRILHCVLYYPYTIMICNPFSITTTFSFMITFILLSISHFIIHIHIMIILILLIAVTIISDIVIKIIWTKIMEKYLDMNENLISEQYQFQDLIKTQRQFLLLVRFGFVNGHPYVFTWRPFKLALLEWPDDKQILYQYMKFVAIYNQENSLLANLLAETKSIKDYSFRNFRKQIKVVRESRISFYSPKLKRSLKEIDDDIKTVKNYIVSYWNAVKDNAFNVSFDMGKHLNEMISICHLNYLHLISLYPNNTIILSNYAKFLQTIMCNPKESQYWLQRKEYLSNKNNYVFDLTQSTAFKLFPAIPKVLKNLSVRNDENTSVQSILSDSRPSLPSQLTDISEKTAFKNYESNEEIDVTASSIYEHGKKAPIPLLRMLLFLSFLLFFLSCGLGFILPIVITGVNQHKIKNLFISVKTISEISNSFSALSYFFLYKSMVAVNLMPSHEEVISIITQNQYDHSHLSVDEYIRDVLLVLNDGIHTFQSLYGHEVPIDSYVSQLIKDSSIDFVSLDKNSPNHDNITFKMNTFQALNFLCSYLFKFGEAEVNNTDLLHNDWIILIHLNSLKIPTEMVNLMNSVTNDMIWTIVSTSDTIWKILCVISVIDFIILPFFIYFTLKVRHHWNYIMKTINTLPRVAIQKVITRNSKEDDEYKSKNINLTEEQQEKNEEKKKKRKLLKRAELKYQNLFLQMTSSRDTSSGVPITQILFLVIFSILISIASFILVFFIHKSLENKLRSMPIRYYLPNLVSTTNYAASTLFLRRILIDKNESLIGDNINRSIRAFNEIQFAFAQYLNLMLFGEYNKTNIGTISSNSKDLIKLMYNINGDWNMNQSLLYSLNSFPHYLSLEILFDVYTTLSNDATNVDLTFDPFDPSFLTYLHYATEHLPIEFIYEISKDSSNQFYNSFKSTFITIVIFEIIIFLIGSISFCILLYQLFSVNKTIRFSLSALSMVDYEYFQDLSNIIDLFSGSSSGSDYVKALNNSMTEMIDVIHEAVIEINEEFLVIDANYEMLDWLNLKIYQLKGNRLNNHIVFTDSKIEKSIMNIFSDMKKEEIIELDSEVYIVSRNLTEKRAFEVIHFRNDNQNAVIIIFKTSHDLSSMRQQISQLKSQIDELTNYAIPIQLRHKECLRGQSHIYNAHFISITSIEMINLNEFALTHSPGETANYYSGFIQKVNELCEAGDRIKFNQAGRFIFIAFNLVKQSPNYYSAVNETIDFLYEVNDFALENGYKIKYASILLKSAVASLNGMEFTLFSSKIHLAKILLKYSKESCATYSSKFHDLLPRKMTKNAIQLKIADVDNINEKQSWAFCLKLLDKSLR